MSENQKEAPQTTDVEVESTPETKSAAEPVTDTPAAGESASDHGDTSSVVIESKEEAESDAEVSASEPSGDQAEDEVLSWPLDPEHRSAIGLLSEPIKGVDIIINDDTRSFNRALNLVLIMLCMGIAGSGMYLLGVYSSPDRDARLRELALCRNDRSNFEQEYANYDIERYRAQKLSDTQIAQKIAASFHVSNERAVKIIEGFNAAKEKNPTQRFILGNTLSVLTEPKNALVYKRLKGEKEYQKLLSSSGEHNVTNVKLQLDDINDTYEFKLTLTKELERRKDLTKEEREALGLKEDEKDKWPTEKLPVTYREETFRVSRYQWVKEASTGNFTFTQSVNLVPDYQDEFYTFDWAKGKAETFETMEACREFESSHDASICRPLPRPENWSKADERKEQESKGKGKRSRRGKRRR